MKPIITGRAKLSRKLIDRLIEEDFVFSEVKEHRAVWFGSVLTFSDAQLACWQVLWENFLRGNLPILQGRVLSTWSGASTNVADLFKRHPAWKTIIVSDGRGFLWLDVPEDLPKTTGE